MPNKLIHKATADYQPVEQPPLTECWECNVCGLPCRVEIVYEPTPNLHVENQPRFRLKKGTCVAGEPVTAEWRCISGGNNPTPPEEVAEP